MTDNEAREKAVELARECCLGLHEWLEDYATRYTHINSYVIKESSKIMELLNLPRLLQAEAERDELKQEEVKRIRYLNKLATWAQQDPTGPIAAEGIRAWVLEQIKGAFGQTTEPTCYTPMTETIDQLRASLTTHQQVIKQLKQAKFELEESKAKLQTDHAALLAVAKAAKSMEFWCMFSHGHIPSGYDKFEQTLSALPKGLL